MIARAGITSRRKAEELILQGRVTVNRDVVTRLGVKIDPEKESVKIDGIPLPRMVSKIYLLLNKPKGYISAVSGPSGRPLVTDLLKKPGKRVFPVGRLDYDAEGVLILTNDGELANRLIHPRYNIPKRYHVKVKGIPDGRDIKRLERGIHLEDGKTLPARAKIIKETKENSWIEITVYEGRNRLVKRMCMAIGHPVAKLKRIEFAGIKLGNMKSGSYRVLTPKEMDLLKKKIEKNRRS
ncbi:MAG: pseudouridine synthase [Thermodesulfobacteriota bacterium]